MSPTTNERPEPRNAGLGPLLGQGRAAEIYAWGDDQVLKLFRGPWTGMAEREARVAQAACSSGVRTPRVLGLTQVDGRPGILFERIDSPSMLHSLVTWPWQVWRSARAFAGLHFAVHQCAVPGLTPAREAVEQGIRRADALPAREKEGVLALLARLPDGDRLCHGDFHPDQIMYSSRGPVVIDWGNAVQGDPLLDVAQTCLLLRLGAMPPGTPLPAQILAQALRRTFHAAYVRHYLHLSAADRQQVAAWEAPLAAARLGAGLPEERAAAEPDPGRARRAAMSARPGTGLLVTRRLVQPSRAKEQHEH